ncbi:MAG: IPT/TIG domain-containing protein, partial [Ignavibacterium album]|nr:IPT/TIG domain-containing protein [Ignavibacterium album]
MKGIIYLLIIISVISFECNNVNAQVNINERSVLINYGIDPDNYEQVIDSLSSTDYDKRWFLISWIKTAKISAAISELKLLYHRPYSISLPMSRGLEQQSMILKAIIELEDTSFQEEIRQELDTLALNDENAYEIIRFSSYLQLKHNDSYGWQHMKKYFLYNYTEDFIYSMIYYLKPFIYSSHHEEVIEILRSLATFDIVALKYLREINDPESESLAINMALSSTNSYYRTAAREILHSIDNYSYVTTLKQLLDTLTESRLSIYLELLEAAQPSIYKFVLDLYNVNQYPADSSIIVQALDMKWLFYPDPVANVVDVIDSLSSALFQFYNFGWIGDVNFVNELNTYVLNSKTYYILNDTVSCINQLKLLRGKIDFEIRDTIDIVNTFLNEEAWKYLYPRIYFIERKIDETWENDVLFSINPSSVPAGTPATRVRLTGSGFSHGSLAYWDKNYYLDFYVISPSEMDIIIPQTFLNKPGEYEIDVSNYIARVENSLPFSVEPPVLDLVALVPAVAILNSGAFTIEVLGSGFTSSATVYFGGQEKLTTFVSDSVITAEILSSDVIVVGSFPVWVKDKYSISDTLQFSVMQVSNPNLVVNLKNSLGNQIPANNVMYYEGKWKDAVNNGDGTFTVITTKPTVSIRMFYEYANQTVHNVPAQNNTYTFQTVNATVQLQNSLGNLIDQGTVQYYAGAWRSFGTTVNGVANKELLPINYSFRMIYEYVLLDKQQDISTNSTVTFSTVLCTVKVTKA